MQCFWSVPAAFILLGLFCREATAQHPIIGVRLLAGYRYEARTGMDDFGARIFKDGGPVFYCSFAGGTNKVEILEPRQIKWKKEQVISERTVHIALTIDDELIISYPIQSGYTEANFFGKVKSPEEMMDLLLMAFSFTGKPPPATQPAGPATRPAQSSP